MATAFQSTLDAILHYDPLDSTYTHTRTHLDTISETTSTSSLDYPTITPGQTIPTNNLPPLDLPLPYIFPPTMSPSRFSPEHINSKIPQVQQPEPRRASASPKNIIKNMDISPNRLSAPRATRGGSSPSRSPYHGLTALSPLQGISPMQPMSIPKPSSGSSTPTKPASLGRIPSRRQSMVQSAVEWKMESEIENQSVGSQSSRLILCKAPKEDEGIFGKVYVICTLQSYHSCLVLMIVAQNHHPPSRHLPQQAMSSPRRLHRIEDLDDHSVLPYSAQ